MTEKKWKQNFMYILNRLLLVSERAVSDKVQVLNDAEIGGVPASFHVWDISRLQRQRGARGHKEPLDLDFPQLFGSGISCLPRSSDARPMKRGWKIRWL